MKPWSGRATIVLALGLAGVLNVTSASAMVEQPAEPAPLPQPAPVAAPAVPSADVKPLRPEREPIVPVTPAATAAELAAGNFTATRKAQDKYNVAVAGTAMTTRAEIENYMLYRTAQLAMQDGYTWFELVEARAPGDKVARVARDPEGPRYSFRIPHWRPVWRIKADASKDWQVWNPFSGAPFPLNEGDKITAYDVKADVVMHKGMTDGVNPLAFEADALSDFLLYQVKPAK